MTREYAENYIRELSVTHGVKVYETNGQRIFPIHMKTPDGSYALEDAYAFYLMKDEYIYTIQIFIDDNMTYGGILRIFGAAVSNFKLKIMEKENAQKSGSDSKPKNGPE